MIAGSIGFTTWLNPTCQHGNEAGEMGVLRRDCQQAGSMQNGWKRGNEKYIYLYRSSHHVMGFVRHALPGPSRSAKPDTYS